MITQVSCGGLTPVEQSLVDYVGRGEWLDLTAKGEAVDEAAMRSWGETRTCRATVIRDILRGRLAPDTDPHGLRLRGARIIGRLDLENLTTDVNFELKDCLLQEGLFADNAFLATVGLAGCQLEHPTEPPLSAVWLTCSTLDLLDTAIIGHTKAGAVRLPGAHIGSNLVCSGAKVVNDSGPALDADGLQVSQDMFLRGFTATSSGEDGAVRLLGAHIGGQLDCDGAVLRNDSGPALHADGLQVGRSMYLSGFIGTSSGKIGAVRLAGSHIGGQLSCDGAKLTNNSGPALHADSLHVGGYMLLRGGFTATGSGETGAVWLLGAHIGGNLECNGAELRDDSGPALVADNLQVRQDMYLRDGFTATGSGETGAVRLPGAHIGGQLDCDGAVLRNDSGPALHADNVQVDQDMYLRREFTATGVGRSGAVNLAGARIGGQLDCDGAVLRNDSGPALRADNVQVDQDMYLRREFTATGVGRSGAVNLAGARIGGHLYCDGAALCNDSGPALLAYSLWVGQGLYLRRGFTATGGGDADAVCLLGAHVGGDLACEGARLCNDSGPALHADNVQVNQDMYLRQEFTATGAGDLGAVSLVGAQIGSQLSCHGASLRNDSGPALRADGLQVGRDMYLRKFTATGGGDLGAVRLCRAHIGSQLSCAGAELRSDRGPALLADGLQVGQNMFLSDGFAAAGGGDDAAVNLTGARVGGKFVFDPEQLAPAADSRRLAVNRLTDAGLPMPMSVRGWLDLLRKVTPRYAAQPYQHLPAGYRAPDLEQSDSKQLAHATGSHLRLAVDGLTYAGVPTPISARGWLDLLRHGTDRYAAQPYQQLAAGYRALGDERQVREILMAQRDDELARGGTRWPERLWGWITKVTLGYGYQPWRALLFLAAVVVVSCVLAVVLGAHGALAQTSKTATPGRSCTVIQQVSVGLDLNLPVGTSVARADCDLTSNSASATAAWLTAAGWVMRLLAWVFAALFIAGFTSAVRKT